MIENDIYKILKSQINKNAADDSNIMLVALVSEDVNINKIRLPTSETAANVQSYATIRKYTDEQQTLFNKISHNLPKP